MLEMIAAALALMGVNYHLPHDPNDPAHWYDIYCCDLQHCRPSKEGEIVQEGVGYRVNGEWIQFDDDRVLRSQDQDAHVCIVQGKVRCLYLPGVRS